MRKVQGHIEDLFPADSTDSPFDEVDGLGHFVELEVVLLHGQKVEDSVKAAEDLMIRLGIREEDLIEKAYMDLLKEQEANQA